MLADYNCGMRFVLAVAVLYFVLRDGAALWAWVLRRFKPATRVENACATGSAAIYEGINAIDARRARFVLCVGVETSDRRFVEPTRIDVTPNGDPPAIAWAEPALAVGAAKAPPGCAA